jgi:hypothetical protein
MEVLFTPHPPKGGLKKELDFEPTLEPVLNEVKVGRRQ